MTSTSLAGEHLPDGEIVRLLDGELSPAEREHAEAHAAACEACGARLRQLRARATRLAALLGESDWKVPAAEVPDELALRRARRAGAALRARPWMRAAAVVALLLGMGVVATPVRAWVAEWVEEQWSRLFPPREEAAAPVALPSGGPRAGSRVQFTPAGETFTLELTAAQAGGAVEVRRAGTALATAEQVGGATPAELLVLPAGVRVQNSAASTASYRVTVPASVRIVRVRVGSAPPVVLDAARLAAGARVELRAP